MHTVDLSTFRGAVPYLRAYKGRTFVIKFGGRLCEPGAVLDHVVEQCALLYQLGVQVVLVHGGGDQASALSERMGVTPRMVVGRRVTDAATLDIVKMVFAGTVHTDVLAACRKNQLPGVGVSGIDGGLIVAARRPPQRVRDPRSGDETTVDYGFVGDVASVNPAVLVHLLACGYVPVVCPLAADIAGQVYNINADTVASTLAVALQAAKYFALTSVDGVLRDVTQPSTLCSHLTVDEAAALVSSGVVHGGMAPKIQACLAALAGGVERVHIINGLTRDALLAEVFTNSGCGTLITARRNGGAPASESTASP